MQAFVATVFNLLLVLILVLLNGFFVAAEFAIVKVRSTRIAVLREKGHRRARIAERVLANLDAYLSATQLGITLASLGLGWI
ncbi:MAG: CNNM domain-containing protein, partial [Planifilum fulgidum]